VSTPVTVLTGFLGSGKTTLLNNLLRDPGMADTAVVINEFGEIAIDHLLVEASIENAVVLQSGCICCTVRGDLVDTLDDLDAKRRRGDIPAFSRVAIETTGLADPAPIAQTLASDPLLDGRFHLASIISTVDAVHGEGQLDSYQEAVKQAALADVLLLTKTDVAEPAAVASLSARLRALNPGADLVPVVRGEITPEDLFGRVAGDPRANPEMLRTWLDAEAFEAPQHGHDEHGHGHGHDHHHQDPNRHSDAIRAFCLTLDEPVAWEAVTRWLGSITSLRGRDLLRMKGVVAVEGLAGPVVVQGVQHLIHPPVQLPAWPDEDHRTRIVFITNGIPEAALRASLAALSSD
jgi:G3E family GTPase